MNIVLRNAVFDDAQAIATIYDHYVLTSSSTFEETPPDPGEKRIQIRTLG